MTNTPLILFVLSQYMGLFMLIMAVIMFSRVATYRRMIQQTAPHSGTILLGAIVGLLIGMFLVGINNVWIFKPSVTVTLVCWMVLIFSLLWLSIPERMLKLTTQTFLGSGYYIVVVLLGGFGVAFLSRGVYIYVTHRDNFVILKALINK